MASTTVFSLEEIAKHNSAENLWMVIDQKVYDVTKYAPDHPGGADVLMTVAGADGTDGFNDIGHSTDARKELETMLIGTLEGAQVVTQQSSLAATKVEEIPASSASSNKEPNHSIALAVGVISFLILCFTRLEWLEDEVHRLEQLRLSARL